MKRRQRFTLFLFIVFMLSIGRAAATEFNFTSVDGKTYSSADLKGTPIVLHIGTHW